jgi:hypothetical protein
MARPCQCMEEIQQSSNIRYVKTCALPFAGIVAKVNPLKGFGTLLMEEAERIAREEHGSIKLAVISGTLCHVYERGSLLTFRVPILRKAWAREITIED